MGRLLTWKLSRRRSLTPCQGRVRHRRSLLKRPAALWVSYQSTLRESWMERRKTVENGARATGITTNLRGLWNEAHSRIWRASWGEDCRRHIRDTQTVAVLVSVSHSWPRDNVWGVSFWAKDKKDLIVAQVVQSPLLNDCKCRCHLKILVQEEKWRHTE